MIYNRIAPEAWELATEYFPKPWPRELAVADLEHHRSATHRGVKFPGARSLAGRWGWTHWAARQLLVDVNPDGRTLGAQQPHTQRTPENGETPNIDENPHTCRTPAAHFPPSRDPISEEEKEDQQSLSAEPTPAPAATEEVVEPPSSEPPPSSKLEGLPPMGKGVKPQWLTAPVVEVYRAWLIHHPEARTIRADQVKAIRGALSQGYTAQQLVAAVRYVHEAPEDAPKVRALREGGYLDLPNTLNERTRHQNVELGERWLSGELDGGRPPAQSDTTARPGTGELALRRWYDLEGGREWVARNAQRGLDAPGLWRDWVGDFRRLDEWWVLERWLRAEQSRGVA